MVLCYDLWFYLFFSLGLSLTQLTKCLDAITIHKRYQDTYYLDNSKEIQILETKPATYSIK